MKDNLTGEHALPRSRTSIAPILLPSTAHRLRVSAGQELPARQDLQARLVVCGGVQTAFQPAPDRFWYAQTTVATAAVGATIAAAGLS